MKNLLLLFVGLGLLIPALTVQAEDSPAVNKSKSSLIEKMQGKITSMSQADAAKNDFGGFAVLNKAGKTEEFKLISKTRFFSAASAPIAFSDIKKGDNVTVLFVVTLKGDKDAITVTKSK